MLALSRRLKETVQRTSRGTFSREGLSGFDLSGKTLGVIGTGRIGKCVIKLAHAFDMRIFAYDLVEDESLVKNHHVEYVELERLLKESDIITIHTSGEKLPPYLRLPKKAIAYSVAIKVSK